MLSSIQSLDDISSLVKSGRANWRQFGNVKGTYSDDGELLILNYTQEAQFSNVWPFFETVSRGLILEIATGRIVARPFDKFHNWNGLARPGRLIEATQKMDGSLGIIYRHPNGSVRVATRGSFDGEQAQWATKFLNANYDVRNFPTFMTLLVEIIYPTNRIVVDYGDREDLVLIGVRDTQSGLDVFHPMLRTIGKSLGFTVVSNFLGDTADEFVERAQTLGADQEGWVLRFEDGSRWKVKGEQYKIAHKLMTGISFARVLEAISAGQLSDMVGGVPDEFLGQIRDWEAEIQNTRESISATVYELLEQSPKTARKDFAIWVGQNCRDYSAYMFAAFDGRDITPLIYKGAFKDREIASE